MSLLELLRTVYASLTRHIIRALLATLGIVLGIAAVVAMLAISEGGKRGIIDQIKAQGINNIIVKSIKPEKMADPKMDKRMNLHVRDHAKGLRPHHLDLLPYREDRPHPRV
jgi:ABC-type lipoprotein release transport system permease subunit